MKNNKFKTLYYTGLSVYISAIVLVIALLVSVGTFVVNKIDYKPGTIDGEETSVKAKVIAPIEKKVVYDTVPVYDTIRHIPIKKTHSKNVEAEKIITSSDSI